MRTMHLSGYAALAGVLFIAGCSVNNHDQPSPTPLPSSTGVSGEEISFEQLDAEEYRQMLSDVFGEKPAGTDRQIIHTLNGETYMTLHGSSSCPPEPESVTFNNDEMHVKLESPDNDRFCTADFAPFAWELNMPEKAETPNKATLEIGDNTYPMDIYVGENAAESNETRTPAVG